MKNLKKKAGRKRVYDAGKTKEAILNAAEAAFAEHGFNGVSIDEIAKEAGYNKSLLFQYFGNKLGLYTEVVKRADAAMSEMLLRVMAPLNRADEIVKNHRTFSSFLAAISGTFFDYLTERPLFMRMLVWEQAEGWRTYAKIVRRMLTDEDNLLEAIFRKAGRRGLLRSDFPPLIQMSSILQLCLTYLTYIPLYEIIIRDGKRLRSQDSISRAKEYLVDFVVGGMIKN